PGGMKIAWLDPIAACSAPGYSSAASFRSIATQAKSIMYLGIDLGATSQLQARIGIGALANEKLEGLDQLIGLIGARLNLHRLIVALAGPPGAGKSTIASVLHQRCVNELGASTEIVPMDGFHLDDGVLRARNLLPRKGAKNTFDVGGLVTL